MRTSRPRLLCVVAATTVIALALLLLYSTWGPRQVAPQHSETTLVDSTQDISDLGSRLHEALTESLPLRVEVVDADSMELIPSAKLSLASGHNPTSPIGGVYELALPAHRAVLLTVTAPGYLSHQETLNLDANAEQLRTIALQGSATLRGSVTGAVNGYPVRCALELHVPGYVYSTDSDRAGGYEFEAVPASPYALIRVRAPNHHAKTVAIALLPGLNTLDIVLDPNQTVRLDIELSEASCNNTRIGSEARVVVGDAVIWSGWPQFRNNHARIVIADSGSTELDLSMVFMTGDERYYTVPVLRDASHAFAHVVVDKPFTCHEITVLLDHDKPLVDAECVLELKTGNGTPTLQLASTDALGKLRVPLDPEAQTTFGVYTLEGCASDVTSADLVSNPTILLSSLCGVVHVSSTEPLAPHELHLSASHHGAFRFPAYAAGENAFEFVLPLGVYSLRPTSAEFPEHLIKLTTDSPRAEIDLQRHAATGRISGIVSGSAVVKLHRLNSEITLSRLADEQIVDSNFTFDALSPGRYYVEAWYGPSHVAALVVNVAAGESQWAALNENMQEFTFVLIDASGKPMADSTVTISEMQLHRHSPTRVNTNQDGSLTVSIPSYVRALRLSLGSDSFYVSLHHDSHYELTLPELMHISAPAGLDPRTAILAATRIRKGVLHARMCRRSGALSFRVPNTMSFGLLRGAGEARLCTQNGGRLVMPDAQTFRVGDSGDTTSVKLWIDKVCGIEIGQLMPLSLGQIAIESGEISLHLPFDTLVRGQILDRSGAWSTIEFAK